MNEAEVARARAQLDELWKETQESGSEADDPISDSALRQAIASAVMSRTLSFRYVLPTQLLAKHLDPTRCCLCLKASSGRAGSFNARSVATLVIVPFDQDNDIVLGGSPDPYVSMPLRRAEITSDSGAVRDKDGWAHLYAVLSRVEAENDPAFTKAALQQVLKSIYVRLTQTAIRYGPPPRVSTSACLKACADFIKTPSNGDRLMALCSAFLTVYGTAQGLCDSVQRSVTTASDKATGQSADIECLKGSDSVEIVVEAKDCELTLSQVRAKVRRLREREVDPDHPVYPRMIFVTEKGVRAQDAQDVRDLVVTEFANGLSIDILDFASLAGPVIALHPECLRSEFLRQVGRELDNYRSDLRHRQEWASILSTLSNLSTR